MKNQKNRVLNMSRGMVFVAIILIVALSNNVIFAKEQQSKVNSKVQKTESIVREGKIDLKKIDKNKDGKVFQCPMDWNVIADVTGKCPICKMSLKEVTLKDAKENLKKNGFKVK